MKREENRIMSQPANPLHGVRLVDIVDYLVETYGWEVLGKRIRIRCFTHDPSVKSSLTFLRKTPWARAKVEQLYMESIKK
ncbi:VF530 family DNA-binding protein [Cyclobacterium xiamenense]|uniref:VF530 family protein n=1 Tax=Cyclobacterium xiamenense TaxID=1297121 RepID=UPI0035CEB0AB